MRISYPFLYLSGLLITLYIGGGSILRIFGLWTPAYPFLSATNDVYLLSISILGAYVICMYAGGLILRQIAGGIHSRRDFVVTITAFASLGAGASLSLLLFPALSCGNMIRVWCGFPDSLF